MYSLQVFSSILLVVSSFCWFFFLLFRRLLIQWNLVYFFVYCAIRVLFRLSLPIPMSSTAYPISSPSKFIVSGLPFKYSVYSEYIFNFLYVVIQFSQHHRSFPMGLSGRILFCSPGPHVYFYGNSMLLFWLLKFCSIF
jgi:hypothetical protein